MRIIVRFMTLSGKFAVSKTENFASMPEATKAVEAYAASHGFTNVKLVDDGEFDSQRFTARTPGGRGGRNVAFADYDPDDEELRSFETSVT
jgi:hypothetical protein